MPALIQKAISSIPDFENIKDSNIFEGILDTMNDGILIVGLTDKIVYANNKMCEITGYDHFELIGEEAAKMLLKKDAVPKIKTKIKKRKQLLSDSYELLLNKKDGKECWIRISGSPIFDSENNVVGSLGLHTDITERKLTKPLWTESP